MKNDATRAWAEDLRTTDAKQVNDYLTLHIGPNTEGYCCLGRLCIVAGLDPNAEDGFVNESLPPQSVFDFVGASVIDGNPSADDASIHVDWDPELVSRMGDPYTNTQAATPCATYDQLNDTLRLTFAQIADVIDYFGVR